jgi:hypothetical protein
MSWSVSMLRYKSDTSHFLSWQGPATRSNTRASHWLPQNLEARRRTSHTYEAVVCYSSCRSHISHTIHNNAMPSGTEKGRRLRQRSPHLLYSVPLMPSSRRRRSTQPSCETKTDPRKHGRTVEAVRIEEVPVTFGKQPAGR